MAYAPYIVLVFAIPILYMVGRCYFAAAFFILYFFISISQNLKFTV